MASLSLKDFNVIMETENPANKITFQWSVRNINKAPGVIRSSKFSLVSGEPLDWEVSIRRESSGTFTFYLVKHARKDAVPIRVESYSSVLKNGISVLAREVRTTYVFEGGSLGHLLKGVEFPSSGDDTLVFQCAMTAFGYGSVCSRNLYIDDGGRDVEQLRNDYLSMSRYKGFTDVIIIVGDRHFAAAHASVLKSCAPKFFSAYEGEIFKGKINLTHNEPTVIEDILQYIYSGKVRQIMITQWFWFFYPLVAEYDLRMLQRMCTREMIYNMKTDVCKFYVMAEGKNDEELKSYCEAFIRDNPSEFRSNHDYLKFAATRPHLPYSNNQEINSAFMKPLLDIEEDYVIM